MQTLKRTISEASLRTAVETSPILNTVLSRWASIDLPDCWLSGSGIAQSAWNAAFGLSPEYGLADINLVCFDPADLSEEGEAKRASCVRAFFADVPPWIDAKNEACIDLWYEAKFGYGRATKFVPPPSKPIRAQKIRRVRARHLDLQIFTLKRP